jgi:hypothetical protein
VLVERRIPAHQGLVAAFWIRATGRIQHPHGLCQTGAGSTGGALLNPQLLVIVDYELVDQAQHALDLFSAVQVDIAEVRGHVVGPRRTVRRIVVERRAHGQQERDGQHIERLLFQLFEQRDARAAFHEDLVDDSAPHFEFFELDCGELFRLLFVRLDDVPEVLDLGQVDVRRDPDLDPEELLEDVLEVLGFSRASSIDFMRFW